MRKVILSVFVVTGLIAIAGIWYQHGYSKYKSVFLPNTHINNIDVSELTVEQAEEKIKQPLEDVAVHYLDTTSIIPSEKLNATSSYQTDIKTAFDSQDHLWWFKSFCHPSYFHASPDISYDLSGLEELIQEFSFVQDCIEPDDAKIIYENGTFQIQKETEGTKPDIEEIAEEIKEAVKKKFMKWMPQIAGYYHPLRQMICL